MKFAMDSESRILDCGNVRLNGVGGNGEQSLSCSDEPPFSLVSVSSNQIKLSTQNLTRLWVSVCGAGGGRKTKRNIRFTLTAACQNSEFGNQAKLALLRPNTRRTIATTHTLLLHKQPTTTQRKRKTSVKCNNSLLPLHANPIVVTV